MKALISKVEPRENGYRVAQTCETEFEVNSNLFWVDCTNDVVADQFWYDPVDQTIKPMPQPEPEHESEIPESEG